MAISGGITLVYALGAFLPWRLAAFVAAQLPVASAVVFVFLCPESPTWLFLQGHKDKAEETLIW